MIFHLGKGRQTAEWGNAEPDDESASGKVQESTIERWREISHKARESGHIIDEDSFETGEDIKFLSSSKNPLSSPPSTAVAPSARKAEEDLTRRFGANIRSALGPNTVIEGRFAFDTPVRIDGTLRGEVESSSVLIVGPEAEVNAEIKVGSLIIMGNVSGIIDADDLVEVKSMGHLEGSIKAKRFVIEDGGFLQGKCNI